eukprot:gnl/MRDRNA2_/MRDRNA2_222096_c0_seq1.p1 gnl/MRDRNA2_/MRDRNA2_222096_c0~~gnl/MRDRNA2_/MRDRNA2_222096_c0_seq1.p1  ORF type:complete len:299 (-),score=26.04 gnl/MRDRNA2_/MRDRNA2_222096_c0_seq1:39-878(-)
MMRTVGPNKTATHGHSWNPMTHGDQNVHGYPLNTLLLGFAPFLFHWDYSPVLLLNLWIPVQAVKCQPLILMDIATLAASNKLHYHIYAKDEMLGERLNDCWTFTHNVSQRWWYHSAFNSSHAALFSTLQTPHTSTTLPGEDVVQALWQGLRLIGQRAMNKAALSCEDITDLLKQNQQVAEQVVSDNVPKPVFDSFADLLEIHRRFMIECSSPDVNVAYLASQLQDVVEKNIRKSLEMRLVAIHLPSLSGLMKLTLLTIIWIVSFHFVLLRRRCDRKQTR